MNKRRITGYTTGVYAAAAAKAAALAIFRGQISQEVTVELPQGGRALVPVLKLIVKKRACSCTVRKERVEKSDVTAGSLLVATVIRTDATDIRVEGGRGVGLVTRPGLEVPVGERAINPVPRRMIAAGVEEVLRDGGINRGCLVVISVPRGRDLALRTLNGRLGITGGISILGTTGLQIPYSTRAFLISTMAALRIAQESGSPLVVLSTGRRSESTARLRLMLPEELFVLCGDYVKWSIRRCSRLGFATVILFSMPAKMTKLAGGKGYLNRSRGLPDPFLLWEIAGTGFSGPLPQDASVHTFLDGLATEERRRVLTGVCRRAAACCEGFAAGRLTVMTAVVNREGFMEAAWPPWPWPPSVCALDDLFPIRQPGA